MFSSQNKTGSRILVQTIFSALGKLFFLVNFCKFFKFKCLHNRFHCKESHWPRSLAMSFLRNSTNSMFSFWFYSPQWKRRMRGIFQVFSQFQWFLSNLNILHYISFRKLTAWKVSKDEHFSGTYFPVFSLYLDTLHAEHRMGTI